MQTYINEGEPKGKIFDGVNQEDVYTSYDFDKEVYEKNDIETRTYYTEYLKKVKSRGYTVYVLEYANKASVRDEAMNYSKKMDLLAMYRRILIYELIKGEVYEKQVYHLSTCYSLMCSCVLGTISYVANRSLYR